MTTEAKPTAAHDQTPLQQRRKRLTDLLHITRTAAVAYDRNDLVERIDQAIARDADRTLSVIVVGEFKQGKSTLLNALLNASVCGVADDVSTVIPTHIRYGEAATAALRHAGDANRLTDVALGEVPRWSSEQGNPGNRAGLMSIEVALPRKLLQRGLTLIDTPGVGGLDSTHGAATASALGLAELVMFVSDCSQPLTDSELAFMRTAKQRCPNVVLVQTKTDIQPAWRTVVEINRGVLAEADLAIDVLPVSSVVRQRAIADNSSELNDESGFPAVLTLLRDVSSGAAERLAAITTLGDATFVIDQIATKFEAELVVLNDPNALAEMVAQLDAARSHADRMRTQSAKWQQTLNDGIQDMQSDLDHDLRLRMRSIVAEAEKVLDENDPEQIWDGFEEWLHRRLAFDISAHHQLIADRSNELAMLVAEHFAEDEAQLGVSIAVPVPTVRARELKGELELQHTSLSGNALAAVRGSYGGLLMFGMVGQMAGLAMLNPFSIIIGLGLGRKGFRDERKRQLLQRQQQSKIAVRKYVDDINVEASKITRDTIRRANRDLRDEFASRAEQLQITLRESLRAVESGAQQAAADRQNRAQRITDELGKLNALRDRTAALYRELEVVA